MRERAVALGYSAGWGLVKAVPRPVAERAFRAGADAAAVRNGEGARQLRKNLRRVVGPAVSELRMDALVGDALQSYARYWLETFSLETMDHAAMLESFDENMVGRDHLDAALDRGRGVVVALPHMGNWEASGIWLVHHHGRFTTVVERLRPDALFERFLAYRQSLGMEVLALARGQRAPTEVLVERLRSNGVVCLVADRDLSRKGIEVDFFGEPARMPAGPSMLAAMTGASLHVAHSYFVGEGWGQSVSPPVDLPEGSLREKVNHGTQRIADMFAEGIAKRPADWHMLQKLWLADLDQREAGH